VPDAKRFALAALATPSYVAVKASPFGELACQPCSRCIDAPQRLQNGQRRTHIFQKHGETEVSRLHFARQCSHTDVYRPEETALSFRKQSLYCTKIPSPEVVHPVLPFARTTIAQQPTHRRYRQRQPAALTEDFASRRGKASRVEAGPGGQ
jgi:hypothetical protein